MSTESHPLDDGIMINNGCDESVHLRIWKDQKVTGEKVMSSHEALGLVISLIKAVPPKRHKYLLHSVLEAAADSRRFFRQKSVRRHSNGEMRRIQFMLGLNVIKDATLVIFVGVPKYWWTVFHNGYLSNDKGQR